MNTHLPSPRLELRMARLLCGILLLPALTSPLAAQSDPVEAVIVKAKVVASPTLADGQILLSAHSPDGPWIPCLDRTFPGAGVGPVLVRTTSLTPVQYFMSAAGHWFMDDFDDGYRRDWTLFYDPVFEDSLTFGRGAQNWTGKRVVKIPGFGLELTAPKA